MDDNKELLMPGKTTSNSARSEKGFEKIKILLEATGGLSLSQVCAVAGLEGSTVQNWVKRGWVAHPNGKKYEEKHIARILIINALKECIKLEHIVLLMDYVNVNPEDNRESIIKESLLYDYLCDALQRLGGVDDMPKGGVESVVEKIIRDYNGPTESSRVRIRKALTIMICACVCTDVKRRTEAMMGQVLRELEKPDSRIPEPVARESSGDNKKAGVGDSAEIREKATDNSVRVAGAAGATGAPETRRTVAQALREWDMARVESIIEEENESEDAAASSVSEVEKTAEAEKKVESADSAAQKPWYFRRN